MARWKRLLVCLCAAVLAVGLLAGTQAMADEVDIYIMAENDQMLTCRWRPCRCGSGGACMCPTTPLTGPTPG